MHHVKWTAGNAFRFNLNIGKFAFYNRVYDNRNCLPEHIVTSTSPNMFKNELNRHLHENQGLE